ncbi:hypothetical protein HG537_0H04350 [Torulaspora globosa]|uniref:Inosine triphosphate pyrophosphatase n=1 Tax=Torulaspora globosa TaxID=48254 RepID=A0A7H9I1I7_9SACH|nr:hypothetical protein HG537_0H04350 [Torulaspora sp. CBS 2947]
MSANEIIFITGNENKLKEVQMILASNESHFVLVNRPLDLDEVQGVDLEEIALHKCKQAAQIVGPGHPVFVEDTALCFDEFNGLPGAYIKWFIKSMGLAKIVKMLEPFQNKQAQAITTIAYADHNGNFYTFQGITKGHIVDSRGPTTFGWDSIFEPLESNGLTYAEMDKKSKNLISQRGKAFEKFKKHLIN